MFFSYSCCHDKCYVVKYFVEWIKIFSSSSSYLESIVLDWTLPWINLHRKAAVSHWNIQNSKPLRYNQLLVGSHLLADSLPLSVSQNPNIFINSKYFCHFKMILNLWYFRRVTLVPTWHPWLQDCQKISKPTWNCYISILMLNN